MRSRDSMPGTIGALSFSILIFGVAYTSTVSGAEDPVPAPGRPHSFRPIVDGQRVQSRQGDLKKLDRTDVTPAEAKEIDEIYRDLMNIAPGQYGPSQSRSGDTAR